MTDERLLQQRARIEEFQRKHHIRVLTMLFTDIVGSTKLKQQLGDQKAIEFLTRHHAIIRETLTRFAEADEINAAGDSFFCVFAKPSDAAHFALLIQRRLHELPRESEIAVLDRIGIHVGEVFIRQRGEAGRDLFGLQIDTTARIMSLADGDQILLSRFAFDNARQVLRGHEMEGLGDLSWLNHGFYEMKGVEEPVEVCEVGETGLARLTPPKDTEKARRFVSADTEPVLGWRPASCQHVPNTQWTLDSMLGQGGFGEVWLAHHEILKGQRVFKFCFKAEHARSLKREVTLFRVLRERVGAHPGIVTVHDVFFDEPPYYIVMDYVEGLNLMVWAKTHSPLRDVPLEKRLEIVALVAEALQAAHEAGVIHRDVKPSNILIAEEQGALRVKLTDFGIGQVVSPEVLAGMTKMGFTQTMLSTSSGSGTHLYMAPELLAGSRATMRSDLYSLGVVLYQLLVGDLTKPLTTDWQEDIADPLLCDDLRHCLAGDVAKRFAGVAQLAANLRSLPQRRAALAAEQGRVAALEKRAYRRGLFRAIGVALVVVAVLATLAVTALHQSRKTEQMAKRLQLQRAEDFLARDDVSAGLAYLADVVRRDPADLVSASRLLSALRDRSYFLPLCAPLRGDGINYAVAFSPDGQRILTTHRADARIWDARSGRLLLGPVKFFQKLGGNIGAACFSPDGRRFVVGKPDFQVFDSQTGTNVTGVLVHPKRYHTGLSGDVVKAVFSNDGRLLATTSNDSDVVIWDVATGKTVYPALPHPNMRPRDIVFSPDGHLLASITNNGRVFLWEVSTGTKLDEFGWKNPQRGFALHFTQDGRRLLVAIRNGISWRDISEKKWLDCDIAPGWMMSGLALSPDDSTVFTAGSDGAIRRWSALTSREIGKPQELGNAVQNLKLSRDGQRCLAATGEPRIWLWGEDSRHPILSPRRLNAQLNSMALSPDGQTVAVATEDGNVSLWRSAVRKAQPILFDADAVFNRAATAAMDADGSFVIARERINEIVRWNARTGQRLGPPMEHCGSAINAQLSFNFLRRKPFWLANSQRFIRQLRFSPDGSTFISGGEEHVARVWDARTGTPLAGPLPMAGWCIDSVFSRDGTLLCLIGSAETARVWDSVTGQPVTDALGTNTQHGGFSGNGRRVAISGYDTNHYVRVWELAKAQKEVGAVSLTGGVSDLQVSPDGLYFATASSDGTARVWSFDPVRPASPPLAHKSEINKVFFSPDGTLLATASEDQTARVWRWKTGESVGEPIRHRETVFDAVFSPDGHRLATCSADGTVRIWETDSGRPLIEPLSPKYTARALQWATDGQRLFAEDEIWDVPVVTAPAPPWLPEWAEVIGGQRLDEKGGLIEVGFNEYERFRKRVPSLAGTDVYGRTLRWFFDASPDRRLSPDSAVKAADQTARMLNSFKSYIVAEALQLDPSNARAWASAAILAANASETLEGKTLQTIQYQLSRAKTLNPREPALWLGESVVLEKTGKPDEARSAAQRATELGPNEPRAWLQLAHLASHSGHTEEALAACNRGLEAAGPAGGDSDIERRVALRMRAYILRQLGRRPEAGRDMAALLDIPPRNPAATPRQVDLSSDYNFALTTGQGLGLGHDFSLLPSGLQTFAGTLFDVRGIVQLAKTEDGQEWPKEVRDIKIGMSCQKLHFMHASRNTRDKSGVTIAAYVVHFGDGQSLEIPLVNSRNIAEQYGGLKLPASLVVIWKGFSPVSKRYGFPMYLYKLTWQNPRPDALVENIDFVSKTEHSAPFLVAITAE